MAKAPRLSNSELETALAEANSEITTLNGEKARLQGEIDKANFQILSLKQENDNLHKECNTLARELTAQKEMRDAVHEKLEESQDREGALVRERNELKSRVQVLEQVLQATKELHAKSEGVARGQETTISTLKQIITDIFDNTTDKIRK